MKAELGTVVIIQSAVDDHRLGIINYTDEFIGDCPDEVMDNLNQRLMLLRRYPSAVAGMTTGIFASQEFDIVGPKDQVPHYRIVILKYPRKSRPPCYDIRIEKF